MGTAILEPDARSVGAIVANAQIRYFCIVMPTVGPQAGYDYLEALEKSGIGVRACPIGPAFLMYGPWPKVKHLFFIGQVEKRYVNIVCAPPNMLMGHVLRVVDVRPPTDVEEVMKGEDATPTEPIPKRVKRDSDVIYEPQTALGGLFTVGVPNIAITKPGPVAPDPKEISILKQYDMVLCPTAEDVEEFKKLGVTAFHVLPDEKQLGKLVYQLL